MQFDFNFGTHIESNFDACKILNKLEDGIMTLNTIAKVTRPACSAF